MKLGPGTDDVFEMRDDGRAKRWDGKGEFANEMQLCICIYDQCVEMKEIFEFNCTF